MRLGSLIFLMLCAVVSIAATGLSIGAISIGSSPILGTCTSGQFLQDQSGIVGCAATTQDTRPFLLANTTFYADDSVGNDANKPCLSSGSPCTINGAIQSAQTYDLNNFNVTIQDSTGTRTTNTGLIFGNFTGTGTVTFDGGGNTISVSNNVVNGLNINAIESIQPGLTPIIIQNVHLKTTNSGGCVAVGSCGWCVVAQNAMYFIINTGVFFDGCSNAAIGSVAGGAFVQFSPTSDAHFTAGGQAMFESSEGGAIGYSDAAITLTLTGTPAYSIAVAEAAVLGIIQLPAHTATVPGVIFSGAATGPQFQSTQNSVIYRGDPGGSPFPGSTTGLIDCTLGGTTPGGTVIPPAPTKGTCFYGTYE